MLVKIRGIHTVRRQLADGSKETYYSAWRGGPRMKEQPHTEAFSRNHSLLKEAAEASKVVLTLDRLIEHFTGPEHERNPDFLALAGSTRVDHLNAFRLVRSNWPEYPLGFIQEKGFKGEIRKWHQSMRANPRKADKALFSLSKVFSYAIERLANVFGLAP